MGTNGKSIRDGAIPGTAAAATVVLFTHLGFSVTESAVLGPFAAAVAAWLYRTLRARWPWLAEFDA